MKKTLLKKVERIRLLAMLLVTLCVYGTASAQISSDEISETIVIDGSMAVNWVNDPTNPWIISPDGSFVRIPVKEGAQSTTLSMVYTSEYFVDIALDWYFMTDEGSTFTVRMDGIEKTVDRSWDWESFHAVLPQGSHKIDFMVEMTNSDNDSYFVGIKNVQAKEYKPLETACLKEGSLPLTFKNDPAHMWLTEDGYIRSMTQGLQGETTSTISTTFSIDRPSLFSLECRNQMNNGYYSDTKIVIDDVQYGAYGSSDWEYMSVVLYPGEHTIEMTNWSSAEGYYNDARISEIRNVCLDQTWYPVALNSPGDLRTRLLQALNGKNFQDAELVKIAGEMNEDDWSTIKQLTNIKAIDLTDATITAIPESACNGLTYLSTVMLPGTLKEIGNRAFYQTNFHRLTIPAGVERIGQEVWGDTPLQYIDFEKNSKLKYIGYRSFASTRIMEFIMPDSVELLGRIYGDDNRPYYESYIFSGCHALKKLHFSNNLKIIPAYVAYDCPLLEEVEISDSAENIEHHAFWAVKALKSIKLPETLLAIGGYAFQDTGLESIVIPKNVYTLSEGAFRSCPNLRNVTLNSLTWNMNYTFNYCEAIETVVLPCATPPSIYEYCDPFNGVNKDNVKLIVPDFAIDAYRGDSYWYQFSRNITSTDEASLNDYWGIRGNIVLDAEHLMQGTPSLEVFKGGSITFENDTPQNFDAVTYNTNESAPSSFLSKSNAVKGNSLVTKFEVESADRWYFFSPVTDVRMADVTYSSSDSWVIRYYDGARRASENTTSGNWVNVPSDGTLKRGQGYIIQALEPGWLTMPAAASGHDAFFGNNEVTMPLDDNASETEENAGWNFVANPYPCYYDVYYINMEAPITVWNGETYRAYSLSDGDRGDNTLVLRPMQPFFVQKATAGLTAAMTLDGRRTNDVVDRTRAPKPVVIDENRNKLNLEFFRGDKQKADDYTSIVINENASLSYERVRDASKFMSMNTEVAQLYSLGENRHPMAINERPYEDGNVALGVYLPKTGETYRIAARRADRQAWIYDAETGIEQDLTEGDYIFTASKTGIDNKRFSIRFAPASTAVDGVEVSAVKVTGNVGSISVTAPADAEVAVFGTDGSVITNTMASDGHIEIAVAVGVYVVKVNGESFKTIVK